jgi:protein-disulfide isomerase
VAVVDGRPVRPEELDAKAREAADRLPEDLAAARRKALDEEVRDRILASEARRRGGSDDRLYLVEIVRPLRPPTEAQVRAAYDARPSFHGRPFDEAKEWVAGVLWDEAEAKRYDEWCRAREKKLGVRRERDAGAAGLAPGDILAVVAGQPITAKEVEQRAAPKIYLVRAQAAFLQSEALETAVRQRLLKAEADREGIAPEALLERERKAAAHAPTGEDVERELARRGEAATADAAQRAEVSSELERASQEAAETAFYERLKKSTAVEIRRPAATVDPLTLALVSEGSPWRGGERAAVTVVEFGDFECPACGQMKPMVEEALRPHGDRVRLVFRQFPLRMHPHARLAAEASLAANAQGKFWPYYDALYANQKSLEETALIERARQLGLDDERFADDLKRHRFEVDVVHDIRDGRRYGVWGTPMIYVDGVVFDPPDEDPQSLARMVAVAVERSDTAAPSAHP